MERRAADGGSILCSRQALPLPWLLAANLEEVSVGGRQREIGGGDGEDDLSVAIQGGGDMKRTAAGESSISLPPPSSLRLSHPPSTPVISQRGRMPYGCKELLSKMFSLS